MSNELKISIITVTFNAERTIEQLLSSVSRQTYPNIEYIIIDGQSTDRTKEIINKYKNYVNVFISEKDNGIYDAMNKGIERASGDYIQIIGADDCLCECDTIEKVVNCLSSDVDILSCCQWAVNEETCMQYMYSNSEAKNRKSYKGGMVPHAAMFVKSEIMKKKLFDTKYKISADYKFFLSCYNDKRIRIKFIDLPVVYFSVNGTSSNVKACEDENKIIYKELGVNYPSIEKRNGIIYYLIKILLDKIGLLNIVKKMKKNNLIKHSCDNTICRWCQRYKNNY